MSHMDRFDCFLIGADSLLIECGELLVQKGHRILGVISSADSIASWAREKEIALIDPKSDYKQALAARPFDYLFSITHLSIVPSDVLDLPRRLAVNFHDGPLPRYAGLYTPAWALMNRETAYGITWHVMTAGADLGDVLKQRLFDIAPGETSLTLNTKCFEAAMGSFAELVDELASNRSTRTVQDLAKRTYFGRHERPIAACTLGWNKSAVELDALVRALDFGRYPNPLGLATVQRSNRVVAVTRSRVHSESKTSHAPGTITFLDANEIRVATGAGELALTAFTKLCGRPITATEVATELGLAVGTRFDALTPDRSERLTRLNAELAKSDGFWARRLARLEPIEVPYATTEVAGTAHGATNHLRIEVPESFRDRTSPLGRCDTLLAACAVYLARIGAKNRFHLAFSAPSVRELVGDLEPWAALHVPLSIDLGTGMSFDAALLTFGEERERITRQRTWMRDSVARHPELHTIADSLGAGLLPIGLEVQRSADAFVPPAGRLLTFVVSEDGSACTMVCDSSRISQISSAIMERQVHTLLGELALHPTRPIADLELLSTKERAQILDEFNHTDVDYRRDACVHHLFEEQARRTPNATAIVFEDQSLTYAQLDERANQLAAHLGTLGVRPDTLVGLYVERSLDLLVAMLGILKAGGAYVPLDPAFPKDRIEFMLTDSKAPVVITQSSLLSDLPLCNARVIEIDKDWPSIAKHEKSSAHVGVRSEHLAYVIYTSGSTGKPKGVMVEHQSAVNFFVGIDERIPHEADRTWLAVTSLSFDISVLELLWTLTRGFKVVVYKDSQKQAGPKGASTVARPMDFSLFYFSSDESEAGENKYGLLLDGARFADTHGFNAVWTPERHFHAFGGLYPNPAITGAAVAAITKNVQIRAGSLVLPLHHPVRAAEAWQMVDNLSNGRVAVSIASGWQPNDFILAPHNFANAKEAMFRDIEIVQRLWRGESVEFPGATGKNVAVRTLPRPIQKELPVWVTTAGNPETYAMAGRAGSNLLTHLLGQSIADLAPKIELYRKERAAAGFDPNTGIVSLMLHTYVGDDEAQVREIVRGPLKNYLGTSLSLLKQYAWAFPAFAKPKNLTDQSGDEFASLTPEEHEALLEHAFERYYETSGLFGRPETCVAMVDRLKAIGVDEIACLIDFGVPASLVLPSLELLNTVRELSNRPPRIEGDWSIPAQIERHDVTHLQCTPSMMRMLLMSEGNHAALKRLKHVMIGGEAFPLAMAHDMGRVLSATVTNMYGPTETTIWSSTHTVDRAPTSIPIGTPIANTQLYVLDANRSPVPIGVPGELYIGGDGVVRGYLNRPELSAERFLANPFRGGKAARMYRTGDLAKFRADGCVEFLGRTDFQVKIRGYRIELGEIEAVLGTASGVREAVVIAREDTPGDQRLVAYLVPAGNAPDATELKEHLRAKLPEYMVPAHFVTLERLPLTPNGKVDRKALPAPESVTTTRQATYVAPEGSVEQMLLELWQETLGQQEIGVEDNFFDIGGHSLLVVRLHRRLAGMIQHAISLTDLYRFPTIRALTEHLSSDGESKELTKSADRGARRRESMSRRNKKSS